MAGMPGSWPPIFGIAADGRGRLGQPGDCGGQYTFAACLLILLPDLNSKTNPGSEYDDSHTNTGEEG